MSGYSANSGTGMGGFGSIIAVVFVIIIIIIIVGAIVWLLGGTGSGTALAPLTPAGGTTSGIGMIAAGIILLIIIIIIFAVFAGGYSQTETVIQ